MRRVGFRTRKFVLNPGPNEQDYQAAFAYQGAIAYVYLADRSTCPKPGDTCDWDRPPRFHEDVMPIMRAFYTVNRTGRPIPKLKGAIDLIFSRKPAPRGHETADFEVFDGRQCVPIRDYVSAHPRPDLVDLDRRMQWLSAGPYGNRAGDVLLLARSGLNLPIQDRYYFSGPYHSWHGSASAQDSHIPLILARQTNSGDELRTMMTRVAGKQPSQLDVVPLIRALLGR